MSVVATCGAPIGIEVRPSIDGTEHLFSGIEAADDLFFGPEVLGRWRQT